MSQKFIITYPGQGSQKIGMGRDFFKSHRVAKEVFEEVDDSLGERLSKIIFEGPQEKLTLTSNTQPALMAVSIAISRVLEYETKKNIYDIGEVIIGHSLGEYTALCSLGVINLKQTSQLLKIRGKSMQNSVKELKTKMVASIGLEIHRVEKVIDETPLPVNEVCEIANDNCTGQVILSGTKDGVDIISNILKKDGARSIIELEVSAPFHCSLMRQPSIVMKENLDKIEFKKLKSKFVSNVTGSFEYDLKNIKDLLIQQTCSKVKWRQSIINCIKLSKNVLEIGSGKVLSGMNKRINKDINTQNISTLEDLDLFLNLNKENI
ncbi:MAG: ACP S-malonyltransferase [Alphaproteobacteria bacterium]|tara:strand:+ start:602 stop:1564 length:963 start_codon:yes stop_codon:yes gene_type:complete